MAIVYVVTNIQNGKKYVGTTQRSIDVRFKEHCKDSKTDRCKDRPLYSDMNKYGIDSFVAECLEECSDDERFERESYWIDKLDTHFNGYNYTYGGAGKQLYDYKEIANKYIELGSVKDVCDFYKCDVHVVRVACKENGVKIISSQDHNRERYSKKIAMLDKVTCHILKIFPSIKEAAKYLGDDRKRQHITEVCNNKRNIAYGYKWKFV